MQQGYCPECSNNNFVTDPESGEMFCSRCGLVIQEEIISQKPEWRAFTLEERKIKVRVGSPTSLKQFDKGLSTTFQPHKDSRGKALPMKERRKMMRLRKWQIQSRIQTSVERNLSQAMSELTFLSDKLRIPKDVVENAALIYRKALDKDLVRGRSIKGIVAASLYAACRLTQTPRALKTIVEASTRNRKEITRSYRLLQRELEIKMPVDDPFKFVPKIASKTGLDQKTQNLAIEILQRTKKNKAYIGKGPAGVAAAALYAATIMNNGKITQKKVANASGVTEVTVRNRFKGINKSLNLGLR